jgi:hypothetical protein
MSLRLFAVDARKWMERRLERPRRDRTLAEPGEDGAPPKRIPPGGV